MATGSVHLVPAQLGVWAAEEMAPQADAFLISQIVWFDGEIDLELLEQALTTAGAEADVLRMRVRHDADGQPVLQAVGEAPWVQVSGTPLIDDAVRAAAVDRCRSLGGQEARFTAGSVLHPRTEGGWAWEFVVHHLFFDAYGLGLFTRRVAEVYSALVEQRPVPERWFGEYAGLADQPAGDPARSEFWRNRFEQAVDAGGAQSESAEARLRDSG